MNVEFIKPFLEAATQMLSAGPVLVMPCTIGGAQPVFIELCLENK